MVAMVMLVTLVMLVMVVVVNMVVMVVVVNMVVMVDMAGQDRTRQDKLTFKLDFLGNL